MVFSKIFIKTKFLFEKFIHVVFKKINLLDVHTKEIIFKSSSSLIVKIIGVLGGMLVSVFLGRTIGPDGLGIIDLAHRIVAIIIVFTLLGLPQIIIKETAIAYERSNWNRIGKIIYSSHLLSVSITIVISIIFILMAPWVSKNIFHDNQLSFPLIVALIALTPRVISRVISSGLIGYRRIWQSNLVDQTLSIIIVAFLLLTSHLVGKHITINIVAIYYCISRIFVTIVASVYWKKINVFKFQKKNISNELLKSSFPLLFVSLALVLSSGISTIMLGWLSSSKELGFYASASKIAMLTSFLLQITVSTVSPKIASLFHENKIDELKLMLFKVTKGLTIIGFIFLLIIFFLGENILSLWGKEFMNAYSILLILSIGQFINISSGPVVYLLIMTNHEKLVRNISIIITFLNFILSFVLISNFNAIGAAIATATCITLNMIICVLFIKNKLGFLPIKF